MAFDELETSPYSGRPIQLYEFLRNSGGTDFFWRYNSSDRDLAYLTYDPASLFKAVPIKDDGIRLNTEAAASELRVTMPIASEFCENFRLSGTVPSDTVYLRIYRAHADDITGIDSPTATVTEGRMVWMGTVFGMSQINDIEARITCAMIPASFRRGGLRYGYQRTCPHVLYAPLTCKVDIEDYRCPSTIQSITGSTIQAAEFASFSNGWFDGGFLEYALPSGIIERRLILTHFGDAITVMGFPAGLAVGVVASAFPGCDRTINTCITKFNNLPNNGSFPHQPGRNPFDGMPVF
jgi:uncharacterized phage protein (TIGR02218 family)